MSELLKKLLPDVYLTAVQEKALDGVRFLYSGEWASGKTFLLAYVTIETAIQRHGDWIAIRDHVAIFCADLTLLEQIKRIIALSPVKRFREGFEFKTTPRCIRFQTEAYEELKGVLSEESKA